MTSRCLVKQVNCFHLFNKRYLTPIVQNVYKSSIERDYKRHHHYLHHYHPNHPNHLDHHAKYNSRQLFHTGNANCQVVQFNLADIGEGIREVVIKEWYVSVGDRVSQFDRICEVQSDKASVTITSRFDGIVDKIHYEVEETALVGQPIVDIRLDQSVNKMVDEVNDQDAHGAQVFTEVKDTSGAEISNIRQSSSERILTTPSVRKLAAEHSIDLSKVKGTGKDGRIMKEDIVLYIEKLNNKDDKTCNSEKLSNQITETLSPPVAASASSNIINDVKDDKVPLNYIQKTMVRTMTNALNIPHFALHEEIDFTQLSQVRKNMKKMTEDKQIPLSYMPFLVKAASLALRQFPILNASLDDKPDNIIYKKSHNIGIAMDTEQGLIVPNVKNVERLSIIEISIELSRLQKLAANKQLTPKDLTGGTFTLSNIGSIGGKLGIPIILAPEVCIGAIGQIRPEAKYDNSGSLSKALIANVVWSADHRIIDGATMCRFSNAWKSYLEDPYTMLADLK